MGLSLSLSLGGLGTLLHDLRFDAVVEVADGFDDALACLGREHDVSDDVDVSFVDPGEGAFDAAVEVIDLQSVDSDAALLVPVVFLVAFAVD